jgi:hypothetical protein
VPEAQNHGIGIYKYRNRDFIYHLGSRAHFFSSPNLRRRPLEFFRKLSFHMPSESKIRNIQFTSDFPPKLVAQFKYYDEDSDVSLSQKDLFGIRGSRLSTKLETRNIAFIPASPGEMQRAVNRLKQTVFPPLPSYN